MILSALVSIDEKYPRIPFERIPSKGEKTVMAMNKLPTSLIYGAVDDLFPTRLVTMETSIAAATTVRTYCPMALN